MKTAAIYVRVSTTKRAAPEVYLQNPSVQQAPLEEFASKRGWEIYKTVFADRMSGAKVNRPGFRALMEAARRREFDIVIVWKFDRFARSLKELVNSLDEFRSLGIEFVSLTEAFDTSTAAGRLLFTVVGAIAEFERSLIQERIRAGIDYAREHGTRSGNSIGRQKKVFNRDQAVKLRCEGHSIRDIARRLNASVGTIQRVCSETLGPSAARRTLAKGELPGTL